MNQRVYVRKTEIEEINVPYAVSRALGRKLKKRVFFDLNTSSLVVDNGNRPNSTYTFSFVKARNGGKVTLFRV